MKTIAFHLPQFHPIPENNEWWGAGFTEWRNVAKARPLYIGHQQPNIPGDLGFYDLRLSETQDEQADLAKWAGIDGFCYYHYWYAGRLLLDKPLELMLARKLPDFPFCMCWANHDWTAHWAGRDDMLIKQTYPGKHDHRVHYEYLRSFFEDSRYLTIDDKPVLIVFKPFDIPNVHHFVELFKSWAIDDGFIGLHMIACDANTDLLNSGFDAIAPHSLNTSLTSYLSKKKNKLKQLLMHKVLQYPRWVIDYQEFILHSKNSQYNGITSIPTVIPNWDNTPRVGRRGLVLSDSTPDKFYEHLLDSVRGFARTNEKSENILLIKSWNEWAEGNYLEPDLKYGKKWLQVLKRFLTECEIKGI